MTAEQLADYILDIKDRYDDATPEERPHIIQGGLHFLISNYKNEWEIYKIYSMWLGQELNSGKNLLEFYKLYTPLEDALRE
jgi:hypothetical protein